MKEEGRREQTRRRRYIPGSEGGPDVKTAKEHSSVAYGKVALEFVVKHVLGLVAVQAAASSVPSLQYVEE